jgi:hypothetical protein
VVRHYWVLTVVPQVQSWVTSCEIHDGQSGAAAGRAVAQAVSRWLPTAEGQVRVRAEDVGFVVDKVALGQVFSEYFGFPCQSSLHQFLHHHNHLGLAHAEWTQSDPTPYYTN